MRPFFVVSGVGLVCPCACAWQGKLRRYCRREPTGQVPGLSQGEVMERQRKPYSIEGEASKFCRKIEKNEPKRAAEARFMKTVRQSAIEGHMPAIALLDVVKDLKRLALACGWPGTPAGEMAQFVVSAFEQAWKEA